MPFHLHPFSLASTASPAAPATGAEMTIPEMLIFVLLGFGWVMGTLIFLMVMTMLVGKYFVKRDEAAKVAAAAAAEAARSVPSEPGPVEEPDAVTPTSPSDPSFSPEMVAVVAAAVSAVIRDPVRIVAVRRVGGGLWSQAGRLQHFQTHTLSGKK